MNLITTPIRKSPRMTRTVAVRLTDAQAKLFDLMGGAAWLRAQLDAVAQARKAGK